jgi:hypothetical protein
LIVIFLRTGLHEFPSAAIEEYVARKRRANRGWITFTLPYTVDYVELDNIIDMRDLNAQTWLHRQLHIGSPPILYDYFDDGDMLHNLGSSGESVGNSLAQRWG